MTWKSFECPRCHEAFPYALSAKLEDRYEDMALKAGRAPIIMVNCPHCDQLLTVDRETGDAGLLDVDSPTVRDGGVFFDMILREQTWDKAGELLTEGHESMADDVAKAESCFRGAIAISRHHPAAWFYVSVCRLQAGDLSEAISCLEHALEFDPDMIQGWNNLGTAYAGEGKFEEATLAFDRGIAVNPDYPKFYLGKANIAMMQDDLETARHWLHIALEKDPSYEPARAALRQIDAAA
jgi:superkiller protein 3